MKIMGPLHIHLFLTQIKAYTDTIMEQTAGDLNRGIL